MLLIDPVINLGLEDSEKIFAHVHMAAKVTNISYGQLLARGSAFADQLRTSGLSQGDIVIIVLKHSPDLYYSFVGALLAGCIPSFMPFPSPKQDPVLYWDSHRKLFERIGVRALVTYKDFQCELMQHFAADSLAILFAEDIVNAGSANSEYSALSAQPTDTVLLQHSSGTTGLKKGVALSHQAVLRQLDSYAQSLDLQKEDRIASWLPLYHDMGLMACFLLPLVKGVPVISLDPFEWTANPLLLLEVIERYRCTHCWLPNFAFHHIARAASSDSNFDLSSMKAFIDCSETCKSETFRLFCSRFAQSGLGPPMLQTCYAMAENVFAVTQSELGNQVKTVKKESQEYLSVGTTIPGVEIKIVNEQREEVASGGIGEIAITGESLFSGYYKLPEETAKQLHAGWYYSGDLGFVEGGELFISGRKKDLIIVNGRNFYAHDIEFILSQIPGIKPGRAVAFGGYENEIGSEALFVVAETDETDPVVLQELRRKVKESVLLRLDVMIRRVELVPLGWIVKTTSGKISREENAAKFFRRDPS